MPYFYWLNLQDIKIFFEDVDFYAKLSLILDILVKKSTTQWYTIFTGTPSTYRILAIISPSWIEAAPRGLKNKYKPGL